MEYEILEPQDTTYRIEPPSLDPMMGEDEKKAYFDRESLKEAGKRTLVDLANLVSRNLTLGLAPEISGGTPSEEKGAGRKALEFGSDIALQTIASFVNPTSLPMRLALLGPTMLGKVGKLGSALTGKMIQQELAPIVNATVRGATEGATLGGILGAKEGGWGGVLPGALGGFALGGPMGLASGAISHTTPPLPKQVRIGGSQQEEPGFYNLASQLARTFDPDTGDFVPPRIPGSAFYSRANVGSEMGRMVGGPDMPYFGPEVPPPFTVPGVGGLPVQRPPRVQRPVWDVEGEIIPQPAVGGQGIAGLLQAGPGPAGALNPMPPIPPGRPALMAPEPAIPAMPAFNPARALPPAEPIVGYPPQVHALPVTREPLAIAAPQQVQPTIDLLTTALNKMQASKKLAKEVKKGKSSLQMGEREAAIVEGMANAEREESQAITSAVADQLLVHNRGSVATKRGDYNTAFEMKKTLDEVERLRGVAREARALSPHTAAKVDAEADSLLRRVTNHMMNMAKPGSMRLAGIVAGSLEGFDTVAEAGEDGQEYTTHHYNPGLGLLGAAAGGLALGATPGIGRWIKNRSRNAAQFIANMQAGAKIPSKYIDDASKVMDRWFTIPHVIGEKFPMYRAIVKEAMAFMDKRNLIASQQMERLRPYFEHRSEKLDKVLFDGTLQKKEFTVPELKAKGLTPDEITGYQAYRTSMSQLLQRLETGLVMSGIDPSVAANAIAAMRHPGYAPLSRFGKYFVAVEDAQGTLTGYYTQESKAAHLAAKGQIQANLQPGEKISNAGNLPNAAPELLRGFDVTTFSGLHRIDQWLQQQLGPQHWMASQYGVAKLLAASGVSASRFVQHLRKQKGVPGYSTDLARNTADYIRSLAHYISVRESKYDTNKLLDLLVNKPDWNKLPIRFSKHYTPQELQEMQAKWAPQGNLHTLGTRYLDDVYNPSGDFGKLREMLFHFYLGGKMSSALVNLTGYGTIGLPEMMKYSKNASSIWAKSMIDAFKEGKLDPAIQAGLKLARHEGVVGNPGVQEMMGLIGGRSPVFKELSDLSGYLFGAAEDKLRAASYIAGRKIAAEKGITQAHKAHEFAKQVVRDINLEYSKADRPRFMRASLGAPLGTFRLFQYNMMSKFKDDFKTLATEILANKSVTPEARNAMKVLATRVATLGAVAGAMGIPGAKLVVDMARRYAGVDIPGEAREKFGKVGELALRGLPDAAGVVFGRPDQGIDLSGAAGYGDVVPSELFTDPLEGVTKTIGGVLPDFFLVRPGKAAAAAMQGDPWKAAEQMLPEAFKGLSVAARTALDRDRAFRTPAGEPVLKAEVGDVVAKGVGFTSARLSRAYDREAGEQMLREFNIRTHARFVDELAQAFLDKDVNAVAETMREIASFNEKARPEYRIAVGKSFMSSVKARMVRLKFPEISEFKTMPIQARGKYLQQQQTYKGM